MSEAPTQVDLDRLVTSASQSLVRASEAVARSPGTAHAYAIPEMHVEIRLTLTYEQGKVKGIFRKTQSRESQQVESAISFRVVTLPPSANPPARPRGPIDLSEVAER